MSKLKNKRTKGIPRWQLDKIKMIHAERWSEIWRVVETRNIKEKRRCIMIR